MDATGENESGAGSDRAIDEHEVDQAVIERVLDVGLDPAVVHAFQVTGRLVNEENRHLLSDEDVAEWDAAVAEYRATVADVHATDDD